MSHIRYNRNLKTAQLRNNSTIGEILPWKSGRKCCGLQFNCQKPLGKYIVDFYCKAVKLVIEIDGYSHGFEEFYQKDISKEKDGIDCFAFSEGEVRNNMDRVLRRSRHLGKKTNNPPPKESFGLTPFQGGRNQKIAHSKRHRTKIKE